MVVVLLMVGCTGGGEDVDPWPDWTPTVVGAGRVSPPGGAFVDVSVSSLRSCGVHDSGEISCWGEAWAAGGDPPTGRFVKVSLASDRACAIGEDGLVSCWGRSWETTDLNGLYVGERFAVGAPEGRFVDVSARSLCGVRDSGEVVCWGDAAVTRVGLPRGDFVRLAGPWCALGAAGELACWGDPRSLGRSRVPEGRFVDLDFAEGGGCAVRVEGSVVCWQHASGSRGGEHLDGERDGAFVQVAMGGRAHMCALDAGGDIECWGEGPFAGMGRLRGPFSQISVTEAVLCGLRADGQASCWGPTGSDGQTGLWQSPQAHKTLHGTPDNYVQVEAARSYGCGVRDSSHDVAERDADSVVCWPADRTASSEWELANGAVCAIIADDLLECADSSSVFTMHASEHGIYDVFGRFDWLSEMPHDQRFLSLSISENERFPGRSNACALRADGSAWCSSWGAADDLQAAAAGPYRQVSPRHEGGVCAVRTDGTAYCTPPSHVHSQDPRDVVPGGQFSEIFADDRCALRPDGRIDCWGYTLDSAPAEIGPLASAAVLGDSFGAGRKDLCGVRADGSLVCWSALTGDLMHPQQLPTAPGAALPEGPFRSVHSGRGGLCALDADNAVHCIAPSYNYPGIADITDTPPDRFTDLAIGASHACGIRTDGTMACWGKDHDLLKPFYQPQVADEPTDRPSGATVLRLGLVAVLLAAAAAAAASAASRARRRRVQRAIASMMRSAESEIGGASR